MQNKGTELNFKGESIFVGIDAHKKNWKVSLYSRDLSLRTFTQDPDPVKLVNYLNKHYPNADYQCAYEAGFCGFWIQKQLELQGVKCIVVNPADVPTTGKDKEFKTDPRDCRKIAKSLMNNTLTAIHIHSDESIANRNVVRLHPDCVKNRTRYKNKLKGLINFYGVQYPDEFKIETSHWTKSFCTWLLQIKLNCESDTWAFQYCVQEYLRTKEQVMLIEKQIKQISKQEDYKEVVKRLMTVPGIGLITAMKILTELEDISRFKSLDHLCGYIGIVPTTNSSGEKERIGEMTNRGNKHLKSAIIESSWVAVRYNPVLSYKFLGLTKRMDKNKAIVRIAKKLLAIIMYVLINEKEYEKKSNLAMLSLS